MQPVRFVPLFPFQPIPITFLISVYKTNRGEVYEVVLVFNVRSSTVHLLALYFPKGCSAGMRNPWGISIYENKKGRNKKQGIFDATINNLDRRPQFTPVNFPYTTLWFSLLKFWRVKHGKRLRIWKKNTIVANLYLSTGNLWAAILSFCAEGSATIIPKNSSKKYVFSLPKKVIYPQQTQPITEFLDTFFITWCIYKHNNSHIIYQKCPI